MSAANGKENVDTTMSGEAPEQLSKGKGKATEEAMPVDESEESGEEEVRQMHYRPEPTY